MFFRKEVKKLLNYFLLPYLDYKASHRARLNKRWPFYTERDQKQKGTASSYGTVFSSSHWTTKVVSAVKPSLDISTRLYSENLTPKNYSTLGSVVSLASPLTFFTKSVYYVFIFFVTIKLFVPTFILQLTYSTDPDLLYSSYYVLKNFIILFYYCTIFTLGFIVYFFTGVNYFTKNTILPNKQYLNRTKLEGYRPLELPTLVGTNLNYTFGPTSATNLSYFMGRISTKLLRPSDNTLSVAPTPILSTGQISLTTLPNCNSYTQLSGEYKQPFSLNSVHTGSSLLANQSMLLKWNLESVSAYISSFTDLVKEGMWFTKNFPAASGLHNNSIKFLKSKTLIGMSRNNRKSLTPFESRKFRNSRFSVGQKVPSTTLNSGHYNFFEYSRFYTNNRSFLLSSINSLYAAPSLSLSSRNKNAIGTSHMLGESNQSLYSIQTLTTVEPYHVNKVIEGILSSIIRTDKLPITFTQVNTESSLFSRSDLLFAELINTTNTVTTNQGSLLVVPTNFTIVNPNKSLSKKATLNYHYPKR